MKFGRADLFSILKDVKRQGKRIKLKRRWLLGLPITKRERKKLKENRNRYLPELLRKDDMFYESVRTHVERAFGAHYIERVNSIPRDDKDLNRIPDSKRLILSCLDNLTTKGLYLLAMIVSGVTAKYERTRGCCSQGFLKARIFRRCNTVLQTRGYDFPNNIVLVILCIRAAIKTQQRSQNQKISGVSQAGSGGGSLNIRRNCMHGPNCKLGNFCSVGSRLQEVNVLGGVILPVWGNIQMALSKQVRQIHKRLHIVRVETTSDNRHIVGLLVPNAAVKTALQGGRIGKVKP